MFFTIQPYPHLSIFLCPRIERSGAYCLTVVRLCSSVRPSVCLHKLNIFPLLLNSFSYKAHIWYEGTSHRYTSPGVKVICKGQGQISGSCFSKDGCFRGISVSQTHLNGIVSLFAAESEEPKIDISDKGLM